MESPSRSPYVDREGVDDAAVAGHDHANELLATCADGTAARNNNSERVIELVGQELRLVGFQSARNPSLDFADIVGCELGSVRANSTSVPRSPCPDAGSSGTRASTRSPEPLNYSAAHATTGFVDGAVPVPVNPSASVPPAATSPFQDSLITVAVAPVDREQAMDPPRSGSKRGRIPVLSVSCARQVPGRLHPNRVRSSGEQRPNLTVSEAARSGRGLAHHTSWVDRVRLRQPVGIGGRAPPRIHRR